MTHNITVQRAEFKDVEPFRELYRQEMNCQIRCDSLLRRGLADAYLILSDGRVAGYGGVRNKYDPGYLMEFYTLPAARAAALPLFRELLAVSGATHVEAQTNDTVLTLMLFDCTRDVTSDTIMFEDGFTTHLACPDGAVRRATPDDAGRVFEHKDEPVGDWMLEVRGEVVATGGALDHYNPPYSDIYMEVDERHRRRGYGSYLVQEIKRVCYERGRIPASRCNTANVASRRAQEKAGLVPCARILVGQVIQDGAA